MPYPSFIRSSTIATLCGKPWMFIHVDEEKNKLRRFKALSFLRDSLPLSLGQKCSLERWECLHKARAPTVRMEDDDFGLFGFGLVCLWLKPEMRRVISGGI